MSGILAYIEAYFEDQLSENDRKLFEERCTSDEAFASDVAFYVSARQALKNELLNEKELQWKKTGNVKQLHGAEPKSIKRNLWVRYAVAASVILIVSLFFLLGQPSPQQLALNYVDAEYDHLSQTMGGLEDTLELGKNAYNKNDYSKASMLFEGLAMNHPENAEAKQFAGIAYLRQKNYSKAISLFDSLAAMRGLYNNPGLFLKATALMLRNTNDDAAAAKRLLEQIVKENLDGSEEAAKWLKHLD